jgi:hypothetical protein
MWLTSGKDLGFRELYLDCEQPVDNETRGLSGDQISGKPRRAVFASYTESKTALALWTGLQVWILPRLGVPT